MDSTDKSSSGLELAIVAVDAANTPHNTSSTRSAALLDMNNQPVDVEDEDGLHVVEAEGGGGGSSSQQRSYARLSQEQTDQLEAVFQQNPSPDTRTKEELADRLGMKLDKVHLWFRTRRGRSSQLKRDADHKQQVSKLLEEIKSLSKENASLIQDKILLAGRAATNAEKCISLHEQISSLTKEKHRLESELAEIKETHVPPMILPVNGLPQVFVELCRVCSPIFRDTAAAAGALPGSQKGTSASASTSTAKPCPDCLNILENMEAMVAMVASFAKRQQGGAAAAATTTTPTMPPPSSSGGRGTA